MKTIGIMFRFDVYNDFDLFWRNWSVTPPTEFRIYKDSFGNRYLYSELEVPESNDVDEAIDQHMIVDVFDFVINLDDNETSLSDFGYITELDSVYRDGKMEEFSYEMDDNNRITTLIFDDETIELASLSDL